MAEGRFREDLFYRINVIPIQLPPLRERREDIPLLADHFLAKYGRRWASRETISARPCRLSSYHWPGNIRELENVIERAVALEKTPTILPTACPDPCAGWDRPPRGRGLATWLRCPRSASTSSNTCRAWNAGTWPQALERAGGVQVRAAELLGMSFRSFRYYAKKYNLK